MTIQIRYFASLREALGAGETLALEPEDFVYADPPYDVQFVDYSKDGFSWDDQVRLAHWLARHPGPVVASNQATGRVLKLYRELGFTVRLLDAPRNISCTGDRSPVKEMLATRGLAPEASRKGRPRSRAVSPGASP